MYSTRCPPESSPNPFPAPRWPSAMAMARRPPLIDEAAIDLELSSIINDFLSARLPSDPNCPSPSRRSRSKRLGSMWRFAARAVIKKRYSPASAEEILSPVAANLISPLHQKLLSDALPQRSFQRKTSDGDLVVGCGTLNADRESVIVDIPPVIPPVAGSGETVLAPLPMPSLKQSVCAMASMDADTKADGNTQQNGPRSPPKYYSGRKPPRPPRLVINRSGSYRAARIKAASAAARRASPACVEDKKRQRSRKPSSTRITLWAFIVTLVFIVIVFLQALRRGQEVPDLRFELGKRAVLHGNDSVITTLHHL